MTQAEFTKLYRQARKNTPAILRRAMKKLQTIYIKSAESVAAEVARAELAGFSDLTVQSWAAIENQIQRAIRDINDALAEQIPYRVRQGAELTAKIHTDFLAEAFERAGASPSLLVSTKAMYRAINEQVVQSLFGRIYQNGYTFSERIWRAASKYETDIKSIISAGIIQGRDVTKIAKDIQVYTKDGKIQLANRYGRLERGTRAFMRRIGDKVDSRALRLVRTELYNSIREASREQGHMNPGCIDEYDWILEAGRQQWSCECPDFAAGSPYKYQNVPAAPHPNCHPEETMLETPNGNIKISDIKNGDIVLDAYGKKQVVTKVFKRIHSGELITIETKNGHIKCTPDHPILIIRNRKPLWILAKLVKDSDNLVSVGINIKPISFAESKSEYFPSKRLDIFRLFKIFLTLLWRIVPIPSINLDSEHHIIKSEVDIESTNSKVRVRVKPSRLKRFIHNVFVFRSNGSRIKRGDFFLMLNRIRNASFRVMSRGYIRYKAMGISSLNTVAHARNSKAIFNSLFFHNTSRCFYNLRNSFNRKLFNIKKVIKNFIRNNYFSTHSSAIVSVTKRSVNIPVYNISVTGTHTFIANGFASHNCSCFIYPVLRDANVFLADLKDYLNGNSVDYIDSWAEKLPTVA
jgi:hypothetical protein